MAIDMNRKLVLKMLGYILGLEAGFLLLPLVVGLYYREQCVLSLLVTIALLLAVSIPLIRLKVTNRSMYAREGFLIVSFSWILLSLFGALPFFLSGEIPSYIDSLFETVSGFTTTGASILTNVEALPKSLLFWRSFTHWIGGMGILVFALAILPGMNERSIFVMRAEVPGPSVGKLVPKTRKTATVLYLIYFAMTVVQILLLLLRMPLFDSLITAFGTAGTGGFSNRNASIGAYDSAYVDGIVAVFMLLFGVNFNIYYLFLRRQFRQGMKSEELKWYLIIAGLSMLVITFNILPQSPTLGHAFREASFQVSSIITTTGYATADYNFWPELSRMILFLLMIIGACGGSTGGGVKVSRLIIVIKKLYYDVVRMLHPRSVHPIRLEGKRQDDETVNRAGVFLLSYLFIMLIFSLLVSVDGYDFETTLSSVAACMGNIGPGLGMVGPTGNFSHFSMFSKLILSLAMLLGRLEIFPLFLIASPELYRSRHKKRVVGIDAMS